MTPGTSLDLDDIAAALGGKVSGEWVRAPGPGHSAADDSLAIKIEGDNGLFVHSHAGDDLKECQAYVRAALGEAQFSRSAKRSESNSERTALALRLWNEAQPPAGTPVESYLKHRGLKLPETAELRYHDACPFSKRRHHAMLALVRDIVTDEPKGIHRTALTAYGDKLGRLSLGPIAGGAIKIFPARERLGVGEGIETVLSMSVLPGLENVPVWSLLSSGGLARFRRVPGVQQLFIAVDNDHAGRTAADNCLRRWGRAVFVRAEKPGQDLNDAMNAQREEAF
jgi:hypothetical protein